MKNFTWPENNAVRMFRYYQKLTALRSEPNKTFSLDIYRFSNSDESVKQCKSNNLSALRGAAEA